MNSPLLQVEHNRPGVAVLSMTRPDKRNALSIALLQALGDAITHMEDDPACRVIILRGEGPVFCAGLDLIEARDPHSSEESAHGVRRVLTLLKESRLVTIAAAHGGAYAGGAGLLAACDLVVATEDLKVGFPEIRRGLVPALVSVVLANKVRDGDLRELFLIGDTVSSHRAQQMGLVQRIVPAAQLMEHVRAIAETILTGGPEAVRLTKQMLNTQPSPASLQELQALHEHVRQSPEAQEGLAAFQEHRRPSWCDHS